MIKILNEKRFFYFIFLIIAIGFTVNAIIGYILDLLKALYWFYHLGITIFLILIVIWKRNNELNILLKKIKTVSKSIFARTIWNLNTLIKVIVISAILIIIYFNLFMYPVLRYSIPLTDPYYTMLIDQHILNHHFLYDPIYPHFYPYGIYYNIFFFSSYCPTNLFWIIKFFGPIINSLSILFFGMFISDLTKSFLAGIGSILVWVSSYIINSFGVLTVASSFGIYIALISSFIFFFHLRATNENYNGKNDVLLCSGFLLGGAFLYHSIVGGLFPIFGFIFYFLYEIFKKKKIKNMLKFFGALIITMLPYILLFRNFTYLFQFLNIINNNGGNSIPITENYLLSLNFIDYNWDLSLGINLIDKWGPASIFFIISILSIFLIKDYSNEFIFFMGSTFIALFWIFNPIIINSVPLRDFLDKIYLSARGNYYLVIIVSFFTGIAIKSINSAYKNVLMLKWKRCIKYRKIKNVIPNILIITLLVNQISLSYSKARSFTTIYGYSWNYLNPVSDGYSECLYWLNSNTQRSSAVIIPNIDYWNYYNPILIYRYHIAMAPNININQDSYFYQYLDLKEANRTFSSIWQNAFPEHSILDFKSDRGWFDYFSKDYVLNQKNFVSEVKNKSNVLYLEKKSGLGYIVYNSFIRDLEFDIFFPNSTSGLVHIIFRGNNYNNGFRFNVESDKVFMYLRYNDTFISTAISFPVNEWIHLKISSSPYLSIFMDSTEILKNDTTIFRINNILVGVANYSFYINNIMIPAESIPKLQEEASNELINTTNFIILDNDLKEFLEYFYEINLISEVFISKSKNFSILKVIS